MDCRRRQDQQELLRCLIEADVRHYFTTSPASSSSSSPSHYCLRSLSVETENTDHDFFMKLRSIYIHAIQSYPLSAPIQPIARQFLEWIKQQEPIYQERRLEEELARQSRERALNQRRIQLEKKRELKMPEKKNDPPSSSRPRARPAAPLPPRAPPAPTPVLMPPPPQRSIEKKITISMKRQLSFDVISLPPDKQTRIVEMVESRNERQAIETDPTDPEVVELNVEVMSDTCIRAIMNYVRVTKQYSL